MKKLFTTLMLVATIAVTGNVMAQDATKTSDKPKTETSDKKSCCSDTSKTTKKEAKDTKSSSESKKADTSSTTSTTKK